MPRHQGPGFSFEFLGSGTSTGVPAIGCSCDVCISTDPRNKRLRCSAWIHSESTSIILDTGPDFRTQVLRAGICSLDAVVLTHYHADHVFGIDDVRRFNFIHNRPIDCYLDEQTFDRVNNCLDYIFSKELRPGLPSLQPHRITTGQPFSIGDLRFEPLDLDHTIMITKGFIISSSTREQSPRLAYCVDCKRLPDETLERIREVDILILDMLREKPHHTHLCLEEAMEIIEEIQPKQVWFSHMAHEVDHEALEAQLPKGIRLAYDGLNLRIDAP